MDFNTINVQTIEAKWLRKKNIALDVLRLDKLHPVISGNKWFKLKYYLQQAIADNKTTITTFGGAWSNHIVAAAFACKEAGLKSVGIIRGEKPGSLSETLKKAIEYGMELHFVNRQDYGKKNVIIENLGKKDWFVINEGGYGLPGAKGAAEIVSAIDVTPYSHIVAAAGTGTMLAGLVLATANRQKVVGISCLKGNLSLEKQILNLLSPQTGEVSFEIMHDYHFGGYAKHPPALINFINEIYVTHQLPLDIVYTGKTFYAIKDLTEKNFFEHGSRVLMIHSGGLQGNSSLPANVVAF